MKLRTMVGGVALATAAIASRADAALTLQFDYSFDTNNFFDTNTANGMAARARLNQAASYFTGFTDSLTAITPGSGNAWQAQFVNPSTGAGAAVTDPTVGSNTLLIYVGARNLSGSEGGQGTVGGAGVDVNSSQAFKDAISARGQAGATNNSTTATDAGPWGGSIAFDNRGTTIWNFGTASPGVGESDFLSVAIHELGHIFGYGGTNGTFDSSWAHYVSAGTFTGPNSRAVYGAEHFGGVPTNVPLDAGAAHWAEGTTSFAGLSSQETAMDPTISTGVRKLFTNLDYAGLQDVGWQIPEPGSAAVLASVGLLVAARRRRNPSR